DDHPLLEEIDREVGLLKWDGMPVHGENDKRDVWRYLQRVARQPDARPTLYVGAGDHDPLGFGHRLLVEALPRDRVFMMHGNHDWGPWQVLWSRFLDESDFKTRCGRERDP